MTLPDAVARRLVEGPSQLAWVRLRGGRVVELGGARDAQGLGALAVGEPLPPEVTWAGALAALPAQLRAIPRSEDDRRPSDVVAWEEGGEAWVLLRDATTATTERGAAMQLGNEGALLRERLAGAERLRRDERRARGEALAALGYELLEQGPDGLFRPAATPAAWLDRLCGWGAGQARAIGAGDPTDFLSSFLGEAADFLARSREGAPRGDVRILSSGVWTELLESSAGGGGAGGGGAGGAGAGGAGVGGAGPAVDASFEAHALALSSGRGIVAIESLDHSLVEKQRALQQQREAQLSYEGIAHEMQIKDVLLHCIVHDLRGPLSNLVGSLSLLERGDLDPAERDEMVQIGLRQARRQDDMIRHLLEVFSAEYEALRRFEEDPETAPELVAIAHETAARQRAAFRERGVELIVQTPVGRRRIVGRADRLERVIANLVSNALRHAPTGSAVELLVADAGDDRLRVSVLDRGPGVPEALRDQLFLRFVQGGSKGAAGLGLFYVRMTVERWGGAVAYEPREGGGAAFHVTLQRASESPRPEPE